MGVVSLAGVSKRFTIRVGGVPQVVNALQDVSFDVADGEMVALIGPSGCGKTTALRIVMGLERASAGRILVDGEAVNGCGHNRGIVFQHAELLPWLTAYENVAFGLEQKGMRGVELGDTVMRYLELVGLADSASRRPYQLSGGMQQRVGIARALAMSPDILIADEVTSALDVSIQAQILELFKRLQRDLGLTLILISHDLAVVRYLCEDVAVMQHGRLVEYGPAAQVLRHPASDYTKALLSAVPKLITQAGPNP